jgi:nitroimidazol reductase NimA-like FMN-containing flavoprotein (pyridoxamine 5'-phosphate oxidase superfamily)
MFCFVLNGRQPQVVSLLQRCSLCYLSTFTNDHPHLSLMNFTYYQQDEVQIKYTRVHVVSYHQQKTLWLKQNTRLQDVVISYF